MQETRHHMCVVLFLQHLLFCKTWFKSKLGWENAEKRTTSLHQQLNHHCLFSSNPTLFHHLIALWSVMVNNKRKTFVTPLNVCTPFRRENMAFILNVCGIECVRIGLILVISQLYSTFIRLKKFNNLQYLKHLSEEIPAAAAHVQCLVG